MQKPIAMLTAVRHYSSFCLLDCIAQQRTHHELWFSRLPTILLLDGVWASAQMCVALSPGITPHHVYTFLHRNGGVVF
jgi:hypothetical protein